MALARAAGAPSTLAADEAGALGDQAALLLGQRGVKMKHEGIGVGSELRDNERHPRAIRPATKATSRDRRSSLATTTGHLARRAAASPQAS